MCAHTPAGTTCIRMRVFARVHGEDGSTQLTVIHVTRTRACAHTTYVCAHARVHINVERIASINCLLHARHGCRECQWCARILLPVHRRPFTMHTVEWTGVTTVRTDHHRTRRVALFMSLIFIKSSSYSVHTRVRAWHDLTTMRTRTLRAQKKKNINENLVTTNRENHTDPYPSRINRSI